jgi:hypothetical protein
LDYSLPPPIWPVIDGKVLGPDIYHNTWTKPTRCNEQSFSRVFICYCFKKNNNITFSIFPSIWGEVRCFNVWKAKSVAYVKDLCMFCETKSSKLKQMNDGATRQSSCASFHMLDVHRFIHIKLVSCEKHKDKERCWRNTK